MSERHHPVLSQAVIEPLPEARERGLRVKSFRKRCVDSHWHFHPEIELIWVKSGSGVRHVGRSIEHFSSGDLCLIGKNVPHAFTSIPSQRTGAEWIVGHFLPETWGTEFWALPENREIVALLSRASFGLRFDFRDDTNLFNLFARMEEASGAFRLAMWLEVLERLARCRRHQVLNPRAAAEMKIDGRLQNILNWIEEHVADPTLTQARAAAQLRMSPQAFCRFFRNGIGRSFQHYINEVRVARVCSRLIHSSQGISEIAFQEGFNNLANFNRRFREITGTTPRQYRTGRPGTRSKSLTLITSTEA
jgi:AraC-like DNA-binding protein